MHWRRVASVLCMASTLAAASCAPREPQTTEGEAPIGESAAPANLLARGEYLVRITACNECHTPFMMGPQGPMPDMSRMLSGHPAALEPLPPPPPSGEIWIWSGTATNTAFAGPWGISYAPNLTPHDTGLGVWSEEMFIQAIRQGKHLGAGRPILPPMPWPSYALMTDEDLRAIFAYLKSIPPIENAAPQSLPSPALEAKAASG